MNGQRRCFSFRQRKSIIRFPSEHPSAKAYPLNGGANRHLSYFDPYAQSWTLIRTCFPTHHLNFAKDNVLWTSPGVVGRLAHATGMASWGSRPGQSLAFLSREPVADAQWRARRI